MRPETLPTVDQYINAFPDDVRPVLQDLRSCIITVAPDAVEGISYGMPAYKLNGKPLVYFAGFAKHIGFYATPSCQAKFASAVKKYKQGKGSVQFPLGRPIPFDLIRKMVAFKVKEQSKKI